MKKIIYFVLVSFTFTLIIINFRHSVLAVETSDTVAPAITNISITPNPFNPKIGPCKFSYTTADNLSQKLYVVVNITNIDTVPNKNVAVIIREAQPVGDNTIIWEGWDTWDGSKQDYGKILPSGKYSLYGYITDEAGNKTFFPPPNTSGGYIITLDTNIGETTTDKSIHKGWPKVLSEISLLGDEGIALYDLDGDGRGEIIFGANMPVGFFTSDSDIGFRIYAWHEDGSVYPGWPLTQLRCGQLLSPVSVGDITGDPRPEIVALASWGGLYAYSSDGALVSGLNPFALPNAYKLYEDRYIRESPILFDINNDGKKEIIVKGTHNIYIVSGSGNLLYRMPLIISNDWFTTVSIGFIDKYPYIFCISAKGYLFIWDLKGNLLDGFPKNIGALTQDLAVVNISLKKPYLFFSERLGNRLIGLEQTNESFGLWPYRASVQDPKASTFWKISFLKNNEKLYVFSQVLDYKNDGTAQSWENRNIKLYLFDILGNPVKGWPKIFTNQKGNKDKWLGSKTVGISADVDGDGNEEILIGNQDFNELHAFKIDGTEVSGWPKHFSDKAWKISTAAVGDIDSDGKLEAIGISSQTGLSTNLQGQLIWSPPPVEVVVWDVEAKVSDSEKITWPQYRHDAAHTGLYAPSYRDKKEMTPVPGVPDFSDLSRESRITGKYSLSWREVADDNETGFRDYWNYFVAISSAIDYRGYHWAESDDAYAEFDLLDAYWDAYLERKADLLNELKEYHVYRNGEKVAAVAKNSYFENGLPEGRYSYYVKAVDYSGDVSEPSGVSSEIIIDRTAPTITNIRVSPNPFDPRKGSCKISYRSADNLAKELFVAVRIGQKEKNNFQIVRNIVQNFQPAGDHYLFWDGRNDNGELRKNGRYEFEIYVSDDHGFDINATNIDSRTTSVSGRRNIILTTSAPTKSIIVEKPPEIVILSPQNNFQTNKPALTVNYTVDGLTKYRDFFLREGQNTLTISETNKAGISASKSIQGILDTKAPQLIILSPENNFTTTQSNTQINYTSDGEAKSEEYVLQEGQNTVTVEETDTAGNTGYAVLQGVLSIPTGIEPLPKTEPEPVSTVQPISSSQTVQEQQTTASWTVSAKTQEQSSVENGNIKPKAIMITLPRAGYAPLKVQFYGNRSYDRDGNIVSYLWNFGDGSTSTEVNPVHIFKNSSRYLMWYKVTLTVVDNKGLGATARTTLRVFRELKR